MLASRSAAFALGVFGLAACATAPALKTVPGAFLPKPLILCGGGGSNLPPAGADRQIIDFTPTARLRGVTIAVAPTDGCLSSGYGARAGGAGSVHKGIDLVTRTPRPVFAAADGVVAEALQRRNFGLTILIRHDNALTTRYAHLSSFAPGVKEGAKVSFGDEIGRTGKTGNTDTVHLHYEVHIDGGAVNPLTVGQ